MDATTSATSTRDAVLQEGLNESVLVKKDTNTSGGTSIEKVIDNLIGITGDDLLDKIEEVVKDNDSIVLKGAAEDISQASEQDFLKKLDEIEGLDNDLLTKIKNSSNSSSNVLSVNTTINKSKDVETKNDIDGVIVNKEVFLIESDDNKNNSNVIVKESTEVDRKLVESEKTNLNVEQGEKLNIEEKSKVNDSLENKEETVEVVESVSKNQISTHKNLLKNEKLMVLSNEENKVKNKDTLEETIKTNTPEEISQVSISEPMLVDSNENSGDNKMDVDEDKLEMDIEEENNEEIIDEEMKSLENTIQKEVENINSLEEKEQRFVLISKEVNSEIGNIEKNEQTKDITKDPENIISQKILEENKKSVDNKFSAKNILNNEIIHNDETKKIDNESKASVIEKTSPIKNSETPIKISTDTKPSPNPKDLIADKNKLENKFLLKVRDEINIQSLTNSPIQSQTANVFNSTPINKQFEISSENVSKISNALETSSKCEQQVSESHIIESQMVDTKQETSSTTTTTATTTESGSFYPTSETDHQSSDEISKYINSIKNGIADSTTTDDGGTSPSKISGNSHKSTIDGVNLNIGKNSEEKHQENVYEINFWYEENDIKFLSVQRLETNKMPAVLLEKAVGDSSSAQGSSNGSVTSLPQFTLPLQRSSALSSSGSTSESSGKSIGNKSVHVVKGISELCHFMVEHFKKIQTGLKIDIKPESEDPIEESASNSKGKRGKTSTTKVKPSKSINKRQSQSPALGSDSSSPVHKEGRSSKMSCESPSQSTSGTNETPSSTRKSESRTRKRSIGKVISDDDDEEGKPKAKHIKKSKTDENTEKQQAQSGDPNVGQSVLARWVDKKYYAGRILETKPSNKFVVRFEDGASKVLQKELIVFGNEGILPLKGHKIHALVDDDYECGIVTSIDKIDNKVMYTVEAETATVKVTASEIYLQDDEAKTIQSAITDVNTSSVTHLDSSLTSGSTRNTRHKRISGVASPLTTASPEPGTSAGASTSGGGTGKKGKRQKRLTSPVQQITESSDLTDLSTKSSCVGLEIEKKDELIEGIQQEYQRTPQEIEDQRMMFIYELSGFNSFDFDLNNLLGELPRSKTLFKNKCFLLTCVVGLKPHLFSNSDKFDPKKKEIQFSKIPFVKSHLEKQIQCGGGKIYDKFEDIPKSKYRQCILIAPRPCCTVKYIQCLAANIHAVRHDWIIESCNQNLLVKKNNYYLPAGWSIIKNQYVEWVKGKLENQRFDNCPFNNIFILLCSENEKFLKFWSNVCKIAGGIIRYIKSIDDITPSLYNGYMVVDSDFPESFRNKTEYLNIPIVTTVWIVQSLIMGKVCDPKSNIRLSCIYSEDDDI